MVGTTLGHYRIESEAGSGGMGVVYRGTDLNLKRPAAIKVLAPTAFADPERRRRFLQEAQAASALNHPDIVTIYEIGSEGATDFIAMELVAGRPLDAVISGRPLPLADALRIGARIAGALGAAHRAGIVHRDLKPANVMLTDAGGVKLLDFGVAKLMEPSMLDTGITVGPGQTRTGLIVGTLAYMSPEQARGETVDARSDIYAFGVLFHEMLTGKRPGAEGSRIAGLPRDVQRIVARCLEPERDRRFQNIDDVRLALEDADISPAADPAKPRRSPRAALAAAAAIAVGALAIAGLFAWRLHNGQADERPTILTRLTMDSGLTIDPALSPDGRFIAFASDRSGDGNLDVWVRQVAGGEPVRLTSDAADDREPTFSPDGSQVAFRSDRDGGGIYVTSTLGGDARRIADHCRRPRWSPSGAQVLCWVGLNTGYLISKADAPRVFLVDAAGGGEARRLLASFAVASAPAWSADGRHLIFLGRREMNDSPDWWVASADGSSPQPSGALKTLADADLAPGIDSVLTPDAWIADGRVLFSARMGDATNIWSLRLDANGRAEGPPRRMTAGTAIELNPTADAAGSAIAFAAISNDIDLWKRPLDTTGLASGPPERLTQDPATDLYPALTPDGARLTFASNRSGTFDVWLRDMASGKEVDVAPRIGFPSLPVLTKDGTRVIFGGSTPRRWNSLPLPGAAGTRSAAAQVICEPCDPFWDLTADGKWAVLTNDDSVLAVQEVGTRRTIDIARAPGSIMGRLRISPDDRWMALNKRSAGSIRLYILPFQTTPIAEDRWIPVTPEETLVNAAHWSAASDQIYFLSDRDGHFCVWRQSIDGATGRPTGEPVDVWHVHGARLSMSRMPFPTRGLAVSRDSIVISLAESAGNIWMSR